MNQEIETYIKQLDRNLEQLDPTERAELEEFYREFLLDAHLFSRYDIEKELGTPKKLAHKIMADYSLTTLKTDPATANVEQPQHNLQAIKWILLGLCAVPLGLPLFLILVAVILFFIVLIVLLVGVLAGLLLPTGWIMYKAFPLLLTSNWAVGCFYIGAGIMVCAVIFLVGPVCWRMARGVVSLVARIARWLGRKVLIGKYYPGGAAK